MRGERHPRNTGSARCLSRLGVSHAFRSLVVLVFVLTSAITLLVTPALATGSISGNGDFGTVNVSSASSPHTFTVSNNDPSATIGVTSVSSNSSEFVVSNNTCNGTTLAVAGDPNDSCTVSVTFEPNSAGSSGATLTASFDDASIDTASLTGTGHVPAPGVSISGPSGFGTVQVGSTSSSHSATVNNTGDATLNASVTASSPFTVVSHNCGSVPGGSSCQISVNFSPTQAITYGGQLTVSSNAASSPDSVSLSGTGANPSVSVSPSSLSFGNQGLNTSSIAKSITVTNSGVGSLTISGISTSGSFNQTENCPGSLAVGAHCTVSVTFRPSSLGAKSGKTTVTTNGGTRTVSLSGTGVAPSVSLSRASLNFGDVRVDKTSAAQTLTMKNIGTQTLNGISISATSQFAESDTCPSSMSVGQTCSISVTFHPKSLGVQSGALVISGSAGSQSVALTGRGVAPAVKLKPSSLNFGKQAVGRESDPKIITLTNTGTAPLTITRVSDFGNFSETDTCKQPIAPKGTCLITVVFTPTDYGERKGAIAVDDDAGRQTVAVEGIGITAASAGLASGANTPPYSPIPQSGLQGQANQPPPGAGPTSIGGKRILAPIAGAAGGAILLLLVAGFGLLFVRRRRGRERPLPTPMPGEVPLMASFELNGDEGEPLVPAEDEPRVPAAGFDLEPSVEEPAELAHAEPVGVMSGSQPGLESTALDDLFEPSPPPPPQPPPSPPKGSSRGRPGRSEPTPEPVGSSPLLGLIEKEMTHLDEATDQLREGSNGQPDPS